MADELSLDITRLQRQIEGLVQAGQRVPDLKRQMLEEVGGALTEEVRHNIRTSGLNDRQGRVQAWQNPHMGRGGGYVAVRADNVEVLAGGTGRQPINAGRLTNLLDRGHPVRPPSGRSKRYKPRIKAARAKGFDFYKKAKDKAQKVADEAAQKLLDQLSEEVEKT